MRVTVGDGLRIVPAGPLASAPRGAAQNS